MVRILNLGLERRWNNTQHQPEEAVIRILKFCRLQGGKHSETLVEESRFEVESSDRGTRRRQSTLALCYLLDRDGSDNVASKECNYEDLVVYYPIVAEEVQNM